MAEAATPASGDPVAQNEVCVAGNRTDGSIWVDLKDGIAYTIDGQVFTLN